MEENLGPRFHVGRVVLRAPISGACMIICQIYFLLSEVEMCSFFLDSCILQAPHLRAYGSGFW